MNFGGRGLTRKDSRMPLTEKDPVNCAPFLSIEALLFSLSTLELEETVFEFTV